MEEGKYVSNDLKIHSWKYSSSCWSVCVGFAITESYNSGFSLKKNPGTTNFPGNMIPSSSKTLSSVHQLRSFVRLPVQISELSSSPWKLIKLAMLKK